MCSLFCAWKFKIKHGKPPALCVVTIVFSLPCLVFPCSFPFPLLVFSQAISPKSTCFAWHSWFQRFFASWIILNHLQIPHVVVKKSPDFLGKKSLLFAQRNPSHVNRLPGFSRLSKYREVSWEPSRWGEKNSWDAWEKSMGIYLIGMSGWWWMVAINFSFSQKYWVSNIIPIDELIFFGMGWPNHQPDVQWRIWGRSFRACLKVGPFWVAIWPSCFRWWPEGWNNWARSKNLVDWWFLVVMCTASFIGDHNP